MLEPGAEFQNGNSRPAHMLTIPQRLKLRPPGEIGSDGILRGHGQVFGNALQGKPFHFLGFVGLAVSDFAFYDSAEVSWRDPMLSFLR